MTSSTGRQHSTEHFREIPRSRCEELLANRSMGRVAWNAPDGPELLPVTYAYYNHDIVFRTSPYGVLSRLARRCNVAFEIDEVDHEAGTGWSVVVRGTAEVITEPYDLVELWKKDGLVPWATGIRNQFISITPRSISGRTVKAPFAD